MQLWRAKSKQFREVWTSQHILMGKATIQHKFHTRTGGTNQENH